MNGGTGDYWWEEQYVPSHPFPKTSCQWPHDYQPNDSWAQCVGCGAIPWGKHDGKWYQ